MTPKAVHDYLRTEFDPTLPEFEKLAPGIKTDFSDLVATVSKSGATPGNAYEEAIAAGLASETEATPALGSEDVVEVVAPTDETSEPADLPDEETPQMAAIIEAVQDSFTDAGSDETKPTLKRKRK